MPSSRLLPLLVVAVAVASVSVGRAEDDPIFTNHTCSPAGNYSDDSPYGKNLAELLSTLATPAPATVDNWWFRSRTVGTGPDQASGLAMCYADSDAKRCLNCLATVSGLNDEPWIPECYYSRNVSFISSGGCIVRYADSPFFGSADSDGSGARLLLRSYVRANDASAMREARRGLLSQLAERAGGDARRFATGSQEYVDAGVWGMRHVMYGMAQCTRDLPLAECTSCLLDHLAAMYRDEHVINSTTASLMGLSCYLTYQLDEPIDIAGMAQPPSLPPTADHPPPPGSSSSAPPPPLVGKTMLVTALSVAAAAIITLFNA